MKKEHKTDDQRLVEYVNSLNVRLLALEADNARQDAEIKQTNKQLARSIDTTEKLRVECKKLRSALIIGNEKISNLNLAIRSKNK